LRQIAIFNRSGNRSERFPAGGEEEQLLMQKSA